MPVRQKHRILSLSATTVPMGLLQSHVSCVCLFREVAGMLKVLVVASISSSLLR